MYKRTIFMLLILCMPFKAMAAEIKTIHVIVALCDNLYQRIYPVPYKLGKGSDPDNNLYWGAMYGAKTYFKNSKDWILVEEITDPANNILRRAVFVDKEQKNWIIMDAYRGKRIKNSIEDFLEYSAGGNPQEIKIKYKGINKTLNAGGKSSLIAYVGHNGLMDFNIKKHPKQQNKDKRDIIILACYSKSYFKDAIDLAGATPKLWTNGKMAPEGYVLHAAINSWIKNENIKNAAADAYAKYQKISKKAALGLFSDN